MNKVTLAGFEFETVDGKLLWTGEVTSRSRASRQRAKVVDAVQKAGRVVLDHDVEQQGREAFYYGVVWVSHT